MKRKIRVGKKMFPACQRCDKPTMRPEQCIFCMSCAKIQRRIAHRKKVANQMRKRVGRRLYKCCIHPACQVPLVGRSPNAYYCLRHSSEMQAEAKRFSNDYYLVRVSPIEASK